MIDYEEEWLISLLVQNEGGCVYRAAAFAIPSAVFAILLLYLDEWSPGLREEMGVHELANSTVWNASIGVLLILLGFRTGQAFSRFWEGTGLLHQMRGEWFDTVSNCVTFSISAKETKPLEVLKFRHALVRLMSLCHGSALEEISQNSVKVECIDILGLDKGTLAHLVECHDDHGFNKVEVMLHLVQSLITSSNDAGVLNVPPPILSRVYQTISRGFVNLLNAKKITDTRFPFPYAQLIAVLLFIHLILTPLVITGTVNSKAMAAIFTFMTNFGMFCVNFIASELENPFGTDNNDLPLSHFQEEMNSCLMMLLHTNTDMISGTHPDCNTSFHELLDTLDSSARNDCLEKHSIKSVSTSSLIEATVTRHKTEFASAVDHAKKAQRAWNEQEALRVQSLSWGSLRLGRDSTEEDSPMWPPATSPEARFAELQPQVNQNLDEFLNILHGWTSSLEGQVQQLHTTFSQLRAVNSLRGWEAAVAPCP